MTADFAVDSSALVALLNEEPEKDIFASTLSAGLRFLGWPTLLETRIWCVRKCPIHVDWLDQLASSPQTVMVAFDGELERLAADGFARFGKGRHPAQLNYGDCMAYAVARHRNLPLLFKGADFSQTDVQCHPASVTTP